MSPLSTAGIKWGMQTAEMPEPMIALSSEAIVRKVLEGETALFEVLIRRNNQRLYRAIRSVVRDSDAAEDAMQQTYVLAYQRLSQFNQSAQFSTWLIRIGLNEGLQQLRRDKRWAAVEDELTHKDTGMPHSNEARPDERSHARQMALLVESALDSIPESYRLALVLREVEGLSTAEAADVLDVTEDTVKQRVSRGRQQLREVIEQRTGEHLAEVFSFEAPRCDRMVKRVLLAIVAK